jgi:cation diffusion facilitator CzcD-associated flavoprotein CzcO
MYEHPDFPMTEEKFGVKKGEHIPGKKMLEYLEFIVKETDIAGFLRLNTKVEVVEKNEEDWMLHCVSILDGKAYKVISPKLIIAVGNTNKPKMPNYPTSPDFEPPVIHSNDFPNQVAKFVRPASQTLVIGGGKSAWDVAYACATQSDATVTLLIRPSGNGPNWMTPSHVTPFTLWLEKLVFTRFFGRMHRPCMSHMRIITDRVSNVPVSLGTKNRP